MNMHQKGFANVALIFLIVVLAGALGYVTLVKKPSSTEPQPSLPSTQQVTPPATNNIPSQTLQPSETANLKTYRNEKHGYEIKYSENVKVGTLDPSGFVSAKQNDDEVDVFLPDDGGEGRGSIKIITLIQTPSYNHKNCMSLSSAIERAKCVFPSTSNIESFNSQNITFAGESALKTSQTRGYNIDFSHGDFEYRVSAYFIEANRNKIDSIVSTFRFFK